MFSRWKKDKQAAALDQLWDQLLAADGSWSSGESERPSGADVIELVLARDDAPTIDSGFSAALLKDLTTMHAQQVFRVQPNGHGTIADLKSPAHSISQREWSSGRNVWSRTPRIRLLAGLAVLVILLALGAVALRPDRSPEVPAIPAAMMQSDSGIESETLLDIFFPPGRMRGDDGAQVVFSEMSVAPGDTLEFRISCDSFGIYPYYVLRGTLSAEVLGTSYVLRNGATEWETIPTGQTAEVHAGDTWYFENTSTDGLSNLRNTGTEELRLIGAGTRQNRAECEQSPPDGQRTYWSWVEDPSGPVDPTQPVRLVLRIVTMQGGTELEGEIAGVPIPSEEQEAMGARQWVKILSGELSITRATDGETSPATRLWVHNTVATQDNTRSSDGERVTISNASGSPAEMMVLDIVVGDPGAQGGVAAPPAASPLANP